MTPVFDYIFRPTECENICLYNWICTYEHVPLSQKKKHILHDNHHSSELSRILLFQQQNPLYNTHFVRPLSLIFKWVPNFIGSSLHVQIKVIENFIVQPCLSFLLHGIQVWI